MRLRPSLWTSPCLKVSWGFCEVPGLQFFDRPLPYRILPFDSKKVRNANNNTNQPLVSLMHDIMRVGGCAPVFRPALAFPILVPSSSKWPKRQTPKSIKNQKTTVVRLPSSS